MKRITLTLSMIGLLLLAACASPQQRAQQRETQAATQRASDDAECSSLGFEPGTEGFADCLLRLKEIRAQEARTRALNKVHRDPFWPWYRPYGRYRYPYRY